MYSQEIMAAEVSFIIRGLFSELFAPRAVQHQSRSQPVKTTRKYVFPLIIRDLSGCVLVAKFEKGQIRLRDGDWIGSRFRRIVCERSNRLRLVSHIFILSSCLQRRSRYEKKMAYKLWIGCGLVSEIKRGATHVPETSCTHSGREIVLVSETQHRDLPAFRRAPRIGPYHHQDAKWNLPSVAYFPSLLIPHQLQL